MVWSSFQLAVLLQTIALAISIFNFIAFLWLACTVWLNGDRQSMIARVGVIGLGLAAFLFFLQALLVFGPVLRGSAGIFETNFLWRLLWLPAVGVPYIWFVIGLHYAALMNKKWKKPRRILLFLGAFVGATFLILLWLYRDIFTFESTLRLLTYGDLDREEGISLLSPVFIIPIYFLLYVSFCAVGPWFTPTRIWRLLKLIWQIIWRKKRVVSLRQSLLEAFWSDSPDDPHFNEPTLSWHLARPAVLLAALVMLTVAVSLGVMGVYSVVNWLQGGVRDAPAIQLSTDFIPDQLMILDSMITGALAVAVLLIGYSIVRHGILLERPLARRGFFEQWRGVVMVALAVAVFISSLVQLTHSNLGALLLIAGIATIAYALFTWSNYTAHDRYIGMLRPFLRSTTMHHWLNTDLQKTEQSMKDLFFHLCKDVLSVEWAYVSVVVGSVQRQFTYPEKLKIAGMLEKMQDQQPGRDLPPITDSIGGHVYRMQIVVQGQKMICWVVPIYGELGIVARLYLGPRLDGAIFTDEDMNLAQACGQRILDTLRDHEAMLAVAGLLRRRSVDVKLLGAQQRRILHDEILPQMHLALLHLETARAEMSDEASQALAKPIQGISDAHRQLAAMMRTTIPGAPLRLERDGMIRAIKTMLDYDFQQAFDRASWQVSDEAMAWIDEKVPPAIAELIFTAVQEAFRNAARHARGANVHRRLSMTIKVNCNPYLELFVIDDGVGLGAASQSTSGTSGGLLTHSALLAIAGGSLQVQSTPGEGVTIRIYLPPESLR